MDKKITIPAGIALMVVLAVAGMLAIFSYTAATPVQAHASDVTYQGSQYIGKPGAVTIGFKTDASIAQGASITIGFGAASSFMVVTPTGNVTVNDNNATSATATNQNLAIVLAEEVSIGDVSIVIPTGAITTPAAVGNQTITVTPSGAGVTPGTLVVAFAREPAAGDAEVKGPTAGFLGDYTISFDSTYAIGADADIVVDFPTEIDLEGQPAVTLNGEAVDVDDVVQDGNKVTITTPTGTDIEIGDDVTIIIDGDDDADNDGFVDAPSRAPAVADEYSFMLKIGMEGVQSVTYAAAAHNYAVVFETIPNKPNKNDEVVISFNAPARGIDAGSFITIVMHEDWQVEDPIAREDVTIDGDVRARDDQGFWRTVADAHPAVVAVDDDQVYKPLDNDTADWLIQLEVGDMATGSAFPGLQGIYEGRRVTVTIAKVAGIKAPSEADPVDGYQVAIALVEEPAIANFLSDPYFQRTNRLVTLSSPDGSRGDEIVATAKGWPGEKIDFWRDANADSIRQSSEKVLCDQVQLTDNVAECTFNLDSTFAAGHGDPNDASSNCDGTANPKDGNNNGNCNLVNAVDSENKYALIDGEDDVIELKASVSLSPAEGNPGDSITVQIRDFPNGGTSVDRIEIAGGNDACDSNISSPPPSCNRSLNDRGDADVDIEIPNVDPGTRQLTVHVGTENEDADIVIGGGSIIATPTTVIPNQDVTLVGSGFGTGNNVRITDITLGSDTILLWPMGQNEPYIGDNPNEFDAEDLKVDSGGSWSLSVYVPVTQDTADAGSDGSSRTLTVTDSQGRSGTTNLTFAQRTVTISPEEGRRSSTISLSGENFPGLNKDGLDNLDVTIFYDGKEEESVEPDVNGRWQTTIEVPRDATIPSTNVIRVEFGADFTEIDTYRHRVPRASVTISPASGPEGSMVSLEGTGFGRFESLDELTVGGNDVTVSPNPSTDRDGNATFTFQIPGLDAGTQNVVVDFDGVTASVAFTVAEASGVVGAITSDVEVALEPLLTAGTLDRVFYFNNESKEWQWHIVDADFASTNNLDDVVSGAPLWVLVTEDTSATLNGRVVNFTCAGDDCWNLVTFP